MTEREMLISCLRREGLKKIHGDIYLTPPKMKEFREKVGTDLTQEEYYGLSHRYTVPGYVRGYQGDGLQLFEGKELPDRFAVDLFGVGESKGSDEAYHMVHFHSPLEGEDLSPERLESFPLDCTRRAWQFSGSWNRPSGSGAGLSAA